MSGQQALLSYLFAFMFFTGLSVGSLALLMIHTLTGGAWGERLRPALWAAARTLPLQALLAVPLLLGLHVLYPWADPRLRAADALLRAQGWYLQPTFFVLRTAGYFVLWLALLVALARSDADPAGQRRSSRLAAGGLVVYALTTLFAATDWAMSLLPHWHSSIFGMMIATGWLLGAASLAVLAAARTHDANRVCAPHLLHDFGNLLLTLLLAWAYLAFMQYLTVWVADQPHEIAWYVPRTLTSWRYLAWFLIACGFVLPFAALLSRGAKRRRDWLASIAILLLIANLADALWLIVPNFRASGFSLRWSDLLATLVMGALWLWVYRAQLGGTSGAPALPLRAPLGEGRG